jgi:hypothetical protein
MLSFYNDLLEKNLHLRAKLFAKVKVRHKVEETRWPLSLALN